MRCPALLPKEPSWHAQEERNKAINWYYQELSASRLIASLQRSWGEGKRKPTSNAGVR